VYILGIVEGHNCSAALLKDGKITAVCFEERLSRLKNDFGYPRRAINYCLSHEDIAPDDIDHVAMVTENVPLGQVAVKREATFSVADHIREQEEYWGPQLLDGQNPDYFEIFRDKLQLNELAYDFGDLSHDRAAFADFRKIRMQTIKTHLNKTDDHLHIINHHLAHSMYAIYTNPRCYDDMWTVLAADGYGDDCSASIGIFKDNNFHFVSKSRGSGIGRLYRYVTLVLGMRPGVDEFKVMGLAPYAKEYHWRPVYDQLAAYLKVENDVIEYTNPDKDLYFSLKERLKAYRFDGIAAGLQHFCEDISKQWVAGAIQRTGIPNITYSGGVSMNIKINKVIAEMDQVTKLFVGPSGGDESLSLGAAYALWYKLCPDTKITPLQHTYLGPSYADATPAITVTPGLKVTYAPTTAQIAQLLADGRIIARLKGRMEYGARALGNRSILARADDPDTIRKINDQIKRRDFWMPFAPVILEECASRYLKNPKNIDASYMTIGFESTSCAQRDLKAALHPADNTMRPQIVSRDRNPEVHELLTIFEELTGLGGLLNTSFNLHGEPLCCTPEDGIKTFMNSTLDGLWMDDYLVQRK